MIPASIRYKNPGAMWGRVGKRPSLDKIVATNAPIPLRWGSKETAYLSDGMGQGNNIAIFSDFVHGIAAQIDLWLTSKQKDGSYRYRDKTFASAIRIWSGGNSVSKYIDFVTKRASGITANTIMSENLFASPMGIAFLKAQAWHEAGQKYPAPDEDWVTAQKFFFSGKTLPVSKNIPVVKAPIAVAPVSIWSKLANLFKRSK